MENSENATIEENKTTSAVERKDTVNVENNTITERNNLSFSTSVSDSMITSPSQLSDPSFQAQTHAGRHRTNTFIETYHTQNSTAQQNINFVFAETPETKDQTIRNNNVFFFGTTSLEKYNRSSRNVGERVDMSTLNNKLILVLLTSSESKPLPLNQQDSLKEILRSDESARVELVILSLDSAEQGYNKMIDRLTYEKFSAFKFKDNLTRISLAEQFGLESRFHRRKEEMLVVVKDAQIVTTDGNLGLKYSGKKAYDYWIQGNQGYNFVHVMKNAFGL
eukprot:snap_masked-scaffold_7-processed-gene-11.19-mRNA-1 protein AED:1.00 eAED:1.00 QI:0/-1/0/0/-1/1/1/0/277